MEPGRTPSWADCPPDDDIERVPMVPYVEPDEGRGTTRLPFDGQASCDCKAMPVAHRINDACMALLDAQEGRVSSW